MGHLFEEYGHWTYGMECETNCKVIVNGSFDFLMIKNPKNKIALRVSGDMGNDKEGRTVEIVTEPICIADKKSHDNNMLCIFFIKELFTAIVALRDEEPAREITSDIVLEKFEEFVEHHEQLRGYKCEVVIPKLKLQGFAPVSISGEQLTFGMPSTEARIFLEQLRPEWYQPDKYIDLEGQEIDKFICNYILCMMEHLIKIYNKYEDITSSQAKNSWQVMPRCSIKDLLGSGNKAVILTYFNNVVKKWSDEDAKNSSNISFLKEYLLTGHTVGGHTTNIRKEFDSDTVKQLVFECRQISSYLRNYYLSYYIPERRDDIVL